MSIELQPDATGRPWAEPVDVPAAIFLFVGFVW